jgi:diguanylate cyclase (GGDEF)-like protein
VVSRDLAAHEEETRISSVSRLLDPRADSDSLLVTIYGKDLGRQYRLVGDEITIGRGPENVIVLDIDNVSRRHARVCHRAEGFEVEDLGSTNGTYVNDCEVRRELLRNGDLLKIGGAILKYLHGGNVEALFHEEIYRMTIIDGLTQIHNKRYLLEFMDREMARGHRYERPLSLILFDVDHFKQINDRHGHLAGDSVLKQLAALVGRHVRKEECFARYGGEEFAVLMPETDVDRAHAFGEKIRSIVEGATFDYEDRRVGVTVSVGLAEMGSHRDPESFIRATDAQLYAAKEAGRNRVALGREVSQR